LQRHLQGRDQGPAAINTTGADNPIAGQPGETGIFREAAMVIPKAKNPFEDPNVQYELSGGTDASDILLLPCPSCGNFSHYAAGRTFRCHWCDFVATRQWIDETLDSGYMNTLADWEEEHQRRLEAEPPTA
jgi:hypothetical protein